MKSLFKIDQASGGSRTKTKANEVTYTVFSKGKQYPALVFAIGSGIRKQMRWIEGDRIDVLYDAEMAEGQLVRCKEGGWQLTDIAKDESPARVRISYRPEFGLPLVDEKVDLAIQITDNTICFAFPVKFRKLLGVNGKTTITSGKNG